MNVPFCSTSFFVCYLSANIPSDYKFMSHKKTLRKLKKNHNNQGIFIILILYYN